MRPARPDRVSNVWLLWPAASRTRYRRAAGQGMAELQTTGDTDEAPGSVAGSKEIRDRHCWGSQGTETGRSPPGSRSECSEGFYRPGLLCPNPTAASAPRASERYSCTSPAMALSTRHLGYPHRQPPPQGLALLAAEGRCSIGRCAAAGRHSG